jgi:hypothetical protein
MVHFEPLESDVVALEGVVENADKGDFFGVKKVVFEQFGEFGGLKKMFEMLDSLDVLEDGDEGLNFGLDFLAVQISFIKAGRADLNKSESGLFGGINVRLILESEFDNKVHVRLFPLINFMNEVFEMCHALDIDFVVYSIGQFALVGGFAIDGLEADVLNIFAHDLEEAELN